MALCKKMGSVHGQFRVNEQFNECIRSPDRDVVVKSLARLGALRAARHSVYK